MIRLRMFVLWCVLALCAGCLQVPEGLHGSEAEEPAVAVTKRTSDAVWLLPANPRLERSYCFTPNPIIRMSDKKQYALIETEKGTMKAELYTQETPGTVANFVELSEHGFYDGLTFHRVIPDFVIQGGCPRGDGTGGPGYTIKCETSAPRQYHDRGVLSMAHAGKDTGGSQFFICHNRTNTQHLDGRHTCFGQVVEGLDVIDDIRRGDKIISIRIVEE